MRAVNSPPRATSADITPSANGNLSQCHQGSNTFAQLVFKKHFPNILIFDDRLVIRILQTSQNREIELLSKTFILFYRINDCIEHILPYFEFRLEKRHEIFAIVGIDPYAIL